MDLLPTWFPILTCWSAMVVAGCGKPAPQAAPSTRPETASPGNSASPGKSGSMPLTQPSAIDEAVRDIVSDPSQTNNTLASPASSATKPRLPSESPIKVTGEELAAKVSELEGLSKTAARAEQVAACEVTLFTHLTDFSRRRAETMEGPFRQEYQAVAPVQELATNDPVMGEPKVVAYASLLFDAIARAEHLSGQSEKISQSVQRLNAMEDGSRSVSVSASLSGQQKDDYLYGLSLRGPDPRVTADQVQSQLAKATVSDLISFPLFPDSGEAASQPLEINSLRKVDEQVRSGAHASDALLALEITSEILKSSQWFRLKRADNPNRPDPNRDLEFIRVFDCVDRAFALVSQPLDDTPKELKPLVQSLRSELVVVRDYFEGIVAKPFLTALDQVDADDSESQLQLIELAAALSPRLASAIVLRSGRKFTLTDKSDPLRTLRLSWMRRLLSKSTVDFLRESGESKMDVGEPILVKAKKIVTQLSANGERLFVIPNGLEDRVVDAMTGELLFSFDATGGSEPNYKMFKGTACVLWPDEDTIATIAETQDIALARVQDGSSIGLISVPQSRPADLYVTPQNHLVVKSSLGLVVLNPDQTVEMVLETVMGASAYPAGDGRLFTRKGDLPASYDLRTGKLLQTIPFDMPVLEPGIPSAWDYTIVGDPRRMIALSPVHDDRKSVLSGFSQTTLLPVKDSSYASLNPSQTMYVQTLRDGGVVFMDIATQSIRAVAKIPSSGPPHWINDDRLFATANGKCYLIDVAAGTMASCDHGEGSFQYEGHSRDESSVVLQSYASEGRILQTVRLPQ